MMSEKPFASAMRRPRARRLCVAAMGVVLLAACSRHKNSSDDFYPRAEPIPVHVINENFLDMNVAVVSSGVSRRLGLVTGNSSADFTISPSITNGQSIALTATPIGGRGVASSGALSVGPGQLIDFKIGSVLRQTTATVRQP
jgi:hypothetical protein